MLCPSVRITAMNTLSEDIETLVSHAREAATRAYCRYSEFPVGAAVRSPNNAIHSGCNIENASFGLTVCAERVAIWGAVAAGQTSVQTLAIYTPTDRPTPPCGACRQVIIEFAGPEFKVVSACDGPDLLTLSLAELLPASFSLLDGEDAIRPPR